MKFINGLVSVSFRELSADEIIRITKDTGLCAIEWGGDIHVPTGDLETAERVKKATNISNLLIPEYGSYYRIGRSEAAIGDAVARSARALGTKAVRLWAFDKSLSDSSQEEYLNAVGDAQRLCDKYSDLIFCLECHNRTLTEDYRDALKFLNDVGRNNLQMFWQPNQYRDHQYNIEALKALLPYIHSVHVFSWEGDKKLPLEAHSDR
jgi:sugar phosphate isomerase/epimerase